MTVELDETEALRLARTAEVGRLAWNGSDGVTVLPVNIMIVDRRVEIRTSAYSQMATEVDLKDVGVQVDHHEDGSRTGWSVLIRGRAYRVPASDLAPGPDVWPTGPKPVGIVVEVDQVTGRRLRR